MYTLIVAICLQYLMASLLRACFRGSQHSLFRGGMLLSVRGRFVRSEPVQERLLRMSQMLSHQPVTGIWVPRNQRLQDGFMVSLSELDAPWAQHAGTPREP